MKQDFKNSLKKSLPNYIKQDEECPLLRLSYDNFSLAGVIWDLYSKEFGVKWDFDPYKWRYGVDFYYFLDHVFDIPDEVVKWSGVEKAWLEEKSKLSFEDLSAEL